MSPSARKVWIEIVNALRFMYMSQVTFCEEGVD